MMEASARPTVSVAMTTYNGARYLREQLASLAAQTALPLELVVGDDGSTDDTLAIIAAFAETAPFPVRVHRNPLRLGYRANFMACAQSCAGDLIAFCDQDDIWLPAKLQRQADHFGDPNVLLSCHNLTLIDDRGTPVGREFRAFAATARVDFATSAPFSHSLGMTIVMRRQLTTFADAWARSIDNNKVAEHMAHDQWFFLLASILGVAQYDATPLALYRQHDSNTSGHRDAGSRIGNLVAKFADRRGEYERLIVAARNRVEVIRAVADRLVEGDLAFADPAEAAGRLATAASMYDTLAHAMARRKAIYETRSMLKRASLVTGSVMQGDYKSNSQWHFTPRGALRDLFISHGAPSSS